MITHKTNFYIEDLPENRELEFTERFINLVEEFGCTCAGGLVRYNEDEDKEDEQAQNPK